MAGIDVDGGGIDMFPEQTRAAVTALIQAFTDIAQAFNSRIAEITGLDQQLGNGQGGAAFYLTYQPFVDSVVPQMRELLADAIAYLGTGIASVDRYVQQDLENQKTIQNVNGR